MLTKLIPFLAAMTLIAACTSTSSGPKPIAEELPFEVVVVQEGQFELLGETVDSAAPSTAAGKVGGHGGARLISTETTLKAERGVSFGFTYQVKGITEGPQPGFEMRALHPAMTGPSGNSMTSSTAETDVFGDDGYAQNDIIYTLAEPYEVLPGRWSLQLLYKGRVVLSRDFVLQ